MAFYSYKRCIYHAIPREWREQWAKAFQEEGGREPDGDAGYDGDYWHMAADYIEHLHAKLALAERTLPSDILSTETER